MNGKLINELDDPALNPRHKLRGNAITTAEIARLYFEDGLPIKKVANKVGIGHTAVARRLRAAGLNLRPGKGGGPRPKVPLDRLVSMYFSDELSTSQIGEIVGLTAETIRIRLRNAGHELRQNVPARQMRAWRMNDVERRLAFGGYDRIAEQAVSKQRNAPFRKHMPKSEKALFDMLAERGISDLTQQRAVGIYNMDFATPTIGIEVIGGRNKPQGFASSAERIYFILKSGFHLIELLYREPLDPLKKLACDEVVAFLKRAETLPPFIREYRMIGGSGQLLAVFQVNLDNRT